MNSVAYDIAHYIDSNKVSISDLIAGIPDPTVSSVPDYSIYWNVEPDMPAKCITIIASAGPEPQQTLDHSTTIDETPIQIRVRSLDTEEAEKVLHAIVGWLYSRSRPTMIGTQAYQAIQKAGVLIPLGQDERRRWKCVWNLRVYR